VHSLSRSWGFGERAISSQPTKQRSSAQGPNVIPTVGSGLARGRARRRLPPINPDRFRGDPVTPLRYRRVLHDPVPLALRLEAAIRVTLDPGKYARRLALRFQRRRNPNASLLVIPPRRPFPRPAPRETLLVAGERAAALHHAWVEFGLSCPGSERLAPPAPPGGIAGVCLALGRPNWAPAPYPQEPVYVASAGSTRFTLASG
jgi:hypothetical protein